nr:MAG TPA: hypothetical protein [Inoviridae sp.]
MQNAEPTGCLCFVKLNCLKIKYLTGGGGVY